MPKAATLTSSITRIQSFAVSIKKMWPFLLWLATFYTVWLIIIATNNNWEAAKSHWPIALAMSFGSYIAGSTPMGGGTVGFPVLVLLLDMPGSLGRNFGLAIQSIGMVSASVYILTFKLAVDWKLLKPALLGSLIGTPLGAAFLAPIVPDLWIKLVFAVVWASFGIMHIVKIRELVAAQGISDTYRKWDNTIGLAIGVFGGFVASITGVGIDMIIYAVLVLLYRADLKIAIPTSVIIMAWTSVVGIVSNNALSYLNPSLYSIDPEVFTNWLAAAPVVALGAPFGALIVSLISRTPTLLLVSILCIGQFVWTLVEENVTGIALTGAIAGVCMFNAVFHAMYKWGRSEPVFKA